MHANQFRFASRQELILPGAADNPTTRGQKHVVTTTLCNPLHIVHQPKKSGPRRFCDFLKRERKVQSHAGLGSSENSTFPHSGATLREAGLPLRHVIVGSDPQLPADVGDGRRLLIQAGRHHDDCFAGDVQAICM